VQEVIDRVLANLVESLGATHGIIRLIEGEGKSAQLTVRASVDSRRRFWRGTPKFRSQNPGYSKS